MNKKKFILIISILALSLFSNLKEINAETAKELVCVYKKNFDLLRGGDVKRAFVQNSKGDLYLYTNKNDYEISGSGWKLLGKGKLNKEKIIYVKKDGERSEVNWSGGGYKTVWNIKEEKLSYLEYCPPVIKVTGYGRLEVADTFKFYWSKTKDAKGNKYSGNDLIESESIINDTIRNNFKVLGNRKTTINKSAITKNDTEISNLVCVYKVGNEELRRMIIQSKDGILYFTRKEKL